MFIIRGEYAQSHNGAGGPGVEDKWRNTYPDVPTSYYYHSPPPRPPPESIGRYYMTQNNFLAFQFMDVYLNSKLLVYK